MPVLFDLFKIKDITLRNEKGGSGDAGPRDAQGSILAIQGSHSSRCEGQISGPGALRPLDLK
jgi:hypothetical protein